ncbi:class I SAM-dependent methyltransferase [Sandaracinobacter neustonicus]|uniref:Class I SAM-dependent methyltransferase n=1 Tax=Sandaracinobacter neustonicus TaxID=1715348 RepID=A0A501XNK5_9SPHN|nr:class I SAM-dependent methyltransferase [Sandaracinobacter neustonicus]TPE62252.1 class I SAM-dependent methyltransferase [Sandaracinobacter neustonicus]
MADTKSGHGKWLDGMSSRFRDGRNQDLRAFLSKVKAARRPDGPFRIADLGGTFAYWNRVGIDFLEQNDIIVTCINYVESELGIDAADGGGRLRAETGNACDLNGYADNSFDLVHSNSVIEHVGRFPEMMAFAGEVRRLAPAYYVQTPYAGFPIDPHSPRLPFYHWLPESLRLKAQRSMKVGWSSPPKDVAHAMRHVDNVVLLERTRFRYLFPDARHRFERVLLLPKSMIAERS